MSEYRAIYKCRMCGEKYSTVGIGENMAFQSIVGITSKEFFYPKGCGIGLHRHDVHNCKDGFFGFSDFIGFRKVE